MNCPHCNHTVSSPRNYCGACGGLLVHYCPLCGFRNEAADRYCGGCGAALTEVAAQRGSSGGAPVELRSAPSETPGVPGPAQEKEEAKDSEPREDSATDELLQVAREAEKAPAEDAEARVSQDDIDSLFGG